MPFDLIAENPHFTWDAEIRPVYNKDGTEVPKDIMRGVYRTDTDRIIGRAGPDTRLIQHRDVGGLFLEKMHEFGYELIERKPDRKALYDLKGQKGAFYWISSAKDGAIQKGEIIVGDFIRPTGPSSFLPDGPPTVFRKYFWLNSHDTTYAAQAHISSVVLKCMNGIVSPEFWAAFKAKHTSGVSSDAFAHQIQVGIDMLETDKERMERYIRTPLTPEQATGFFKATIARLKDKSTGEPNWSEALVNRLMDLYHAEGTKNVWAAYMAMTAWATHDEVKGGGNELTARVGRDQRVATTLRTSEFNELLAA